MDTALSTLYNNTTAIALSVAKLKKDIEKMNSSFNEETADLKNRNKITADNSKLYIEKLKLSTKSQIVEINKEITKLNEELKKIDINKEIVKKLKPYATNEALEQAIKDLQKSIDTISLTEGKQGEKGKDGLNGRDGKNGTNGKDGVDGKDGQDGLTPIITEVETETVGAGEYADVEIERNKNNEYKMKFKIPRGQKGASGANNAQGIEDIKVNGTSVVEDKIANVIVPTKASDINAVSTSINQELSDSQKQNARDNINAISASAIKQNSGNSTTDIISQKGVTDLLNEKQAKKPNGTDDLVNSDSGKINVIYIPQISANKKKIITQSSENISVSGVAPSITVTITDIDVTLTNDVQMYPNTVDTEDWLQNNLSSSIITQSNGSFSFQIKSTLPANFSIYYVINEVI